MALAALLFLALAQRAWNIISLPPLNGYDAFAHAAYILTIAQEGRLPLPLEGWSTFHPPAYYLLAATVWKALAPMGPEAVVLGVRSIGCVASIALGVVTFFLARCLGVGTATAWVASALVLFIPFSQMSAVVIGNEAFAAGVTALTLVPLFALQKDPRDLRAAMLTGSLAGLALDSKYSGLFVAGACVVPFLRAGFDRRMGTALGLVVLSLVLVAGPVYLRNVRSAGSLFPMTREREPIRRFEGWFELRPREISDYLYIDPACLLRPSIFQQPHQRPDLNSRNLKMSNVCRLLYASMWYDAFASRIPLDYHRDDVRSGPLLTFLGIVPTLLVILGFARALAGVFQSRGLAPDSPLVFMCILGMTAFVLFTWRVPSMAAVKASYLLPLVVPAGVFFAKGADLAGRRLRGVLLGIGAAAALASAVVFTNGLVYSSLPMDSLEVQGWNEYADKLRSPEITEAISFLLKRR